MTLRPDNIVVACISKQHYQDFLAPNMADQYWPFIIEQVEPAQGSKAVLQMLNETEAEILITCWGSPRLPNDILACVPSLKYVCHLCGELFHLIPRALIEQGLIVSNWGNSIAHIVAEHCLLQTLAALRRATHFQIQMHTQQEWKPDFAQPTTLFNKRVGIHGFGVISRKFVDLLKPFQCTISTYSPHVPDDLLKEYSVTRAETLKELFSENDIIVELAPLTPANRGIVTECLLSSIPDGGVFVNSGRGAVVDETALAKIARSGRIHVASDVFTQEPLSTDSALRGCENVFLTPHIAGPTEDTRCLAGLHALRNIQKYLSKEQVQSQVSLAQYDRSSASVNFTD